MQDAVAAGEEGTKKTGHHGLPSTHQDVPMGFSRAAFCGFRGFRGHAEKRGLRDCGSQLMLASPRVTPPD